MREVPLCRLATSHHLDFAALRHDVLKRFKGASLYKDRGGLDLDFTECGRRWPFGQICRLRHPINTDIGNGRGREAGVQEADFNKPLRGFILLGALF